MRSIYRIVKKIRSHQKIERRKMDNSVYYKARFIYTQYWDSLDIVDNEIVFQSYDGKSISGNLYYMLREVCSDPYYANFKKYIVTKWRNYAKMVEYVEKFNDENIIVLKVHSDEYCQVMARAKYLLTNSTFAPYIMKKDGQVMLNTWHGTPLKHMGRQIIDAPNELGNSQRNFLMSDYLLYPNEFTFERMRVDYMIEKYYTGQYVIGGYPRNTAFFDKELAEKIKDELDISDKKIVVYMPTWRGILVNRNNAFQNAYTVFTLYELDKMLDDDTVLFVKFHLYNSASLNFSEFSHIREFPTEYETYEFLNTADCLITDYSSVLFDYANTGRKIILYGYDKEKYLAERGMYLDYDSLPFTFVETVDELYSEISSIDSYKDYSDFSKEFNKYDTADSARELCDLLFKSKVSDGLKVIDGKTYHNNKPNVLVFGGALMQNGITTALRGFIKNLDKEKYNIILTFFKSAVEKNKQVINDFTDIDYMPIQGEMNSTFKENELNFIYNETGINSVGIKHAIETIYKREKKRVFRYVDFDYVIHFSGYERVILNFFGHMDNAKRIVFVHNDMARESKTRNNISGNYRVAIKKFDKIACVRKSSENEICKFVRGIDKSKVLTVHNFIDGERIDSLSQLPVQYDDDTVSNVELDELNEILNGDGEKFIAIGRFSIEKGFDRLIPAFNDYRITSGKNSHLIIIGGHGVEYDNILNMIQDNDYQNIIVIKSLRNPFPILKKCDLYVLSSRYEGLPMTIMESLALGVPVISTDIPGPSEFLKQGYGYVVEDSQQGIYDGLVAFSKGQLNSLKKFDINEFNASAKKELDSLFE